MKNRVKGRLAPFVPLLKETLDSPAWRAMSHGARSLYVAIKRRYNVQAHNNGRLYLPQRIAAAEIGSSANQVTRWFRELQWYGFIVMQTPGYLGVNGKGRAPQWRLTELGYLKDPPTREFTRWNGIRFSNHEPGSDRVRSKPKTKSRSGNPLHPVAEKGDTSVAEKGDTLGNKCSGNPLQGAGRSVAEIRYKSSLTTGAGGGVLSSEVEPAPSLTVIEGGKPACCAQCGGNGQPPFRFKNGRRPIWLHRRCRRFWLVRGTAS
jgi:hypothetical protein